VISFGKRKEEKMIFKTLILSILIITIVAAENDDSNDPNRINSIDDDYYDGDGFRISGGLASSSSSSTVENLKYH